jgi:hypothetical protein
MKNSTPSNGSPSSSAPPPPPELELLAQHVQPLWFHEERARRREQKQIAIATRDYEKLRREQAKRGGLLPFIRYFWHVLEPPKRKLIEGWPLEAMMDKTVRFVRESMSNRLNDEDSAIVVCMQRLRDNDVSGDILAREADYCHLMIPMREGGERPHRLHHLGGVDRSRGRLPEGADARGMRVGFAPAGRIGAFESSA